MGVLKWSQEDRYFQGLCTNDLALETPDNNYEGQGCHACVAPFADVPQNDCSEHLLPDPTHTYLLRQVSDFSPSFSYPEVDIEPQIVNPGITYRFQLFDCTPANQITCYHQLPGVANLRNFITIKDPAGGADINSYNNMWQPPSTFLDPSISSLKVRKFGDYIVPRSYGSYNPAGTDFQICDYFKEVVTTTSVVSTTLENTLGALITGWTVYSPDKKIHPAAHATRCQFYDVATCRTILGIRAIAPGIIGGAGTVYSVSVVHTIEHRAWIPATLALFGDLKPRGWGLPRNSEGNVTYSWGPERSIPVRYSSTGLYYPIVGIRAYYRYETSSLATFMAAESFTCDLINEAAFQTLPKIDDPSGTEYATTRAYIRGPLWYDSDDKFRFLGGQYDNNIGKRLFGKCAMWHADHLVTVPSTVTVSRIDVTP